MTSVLRSAPPMADAPAEHFPMPMTDPDAEDAVLYGSLQFPRYQHQIVERATDDVITDPKIQAALGWIREMLAAELPVDALTLAAYVEDRGLLQRSARLSPPHVPVGHGGAGHLPSAGQRPVSARPPAPACGTPSHRRRGQRNHQGRGCRQLR